ncbi:MAG: GH3 auxin-responsive promoter family protein, partial [Bacteroidaceae bacterium]|nr:GH3 auxin-responsive promoter family protein [Bacteroidaceae bacterium]
MSITQLARPFLLHRAKEIEKRSLNTEEVQRSVLSALVARAEQTRWGREYGYKSVGSYETFAG